MTEARIPEPLICENRPDHLDEEIEEGYKLTVEMSTGLAPHSSPPGSLEVVVEHPQFKEGGQLKPGGTLRNQQLLQFIDTFREGTDLNEMTVRANEAEKQLKEVRAREKELRKELGKLKRERDTLQVEIARREGILEINRGQGMPVRAFTMIRHSDESGISGTGRVLDGVVWHNGVTSVMWRTDVDASKHGYWSNGVYPSFEAFKFIHIDSHPTNKTEIVWDEATLESKESGDGNQDLQ